MNKEESLRIFVRENLSKLTTKKADKKFVKRLKKDFVNKRGLKSGEIFTVRGVAKAVANEIARACKGKCMPSKDTVSKITLVPFIISEISEGAIKEIVSQLQHSSASILTKEDLNRLRQEAYLEKIEKGFENRATENAKAAFKEESKKLDELKSEILKEREELKRFKSELDELPPKIEFGQSDLEIDTVAQIEGTIWWKEMGLTGDPFPSDLGLIGIPKEVYDDIIVKTRFVSTYLDKVEKSPEEFLGKSIAILGEFGSGKTTLLDMIAYKLGAKGILPVSVFLNPSPDAVHLMSELLKQVGDELCKTLRSRSGIDKKVEYGVIDSLSKLGRLLDDFVRHGGKGLIVSVDGLHKGNQYLTQTWEFLQQLQNVQEFIEKHSVSTGFIVAGSSFWEKEIENVPSMRGSIYKIEVVPPLLEDDAVESVVRRIRAFSSPGRDAPIIIKESLRATYKALSGRSTRPITFRYFLNHIRNRLKLGRYGEVGVSISSHFESVDIVKKHFKNSILAKQYGIIEAEIAKVPALRDVLCMVLPDIYKANGIEESEPMFLKYKRVFHLLSNHDFIAQRKSPREGPFVWSISPSLAEILSEIQKDYSIIASDALYLLFESKKKVISTEADTIYSDIIAQLSTLSTGWKDSWPKLSRLLEVTEKMLTSIEQQVISGDAIKVEPHLLSDTTKSVVEGLMIAGGTKHDSNDQCINFLESSWFVPENVEEIAILCNMKFTTSSSVSQVFGLLHQHADALSQMLDLLSEIVRGEGISRLVNRKLSTEDCLRIHKSRMFFINQSYRDAVDAQCDLLESKVRDIAFSAIRTIWGDDCLDVLPTDIKDKMPSIDSRGHPRTKRNPDPNFFYDLSRSEYSKVLFQKDVYPVLFGSLLKKHEVSQIKDAFELAFSLGDREAHRDRSKYFREHATEIADVLRGTPVICEKFNLIAEELLKTRNFKYDKKGTAIIGRFDVEKLAGIKPKKITINKKDDTRITKTLLSSFDRNPREFIPLSNVLIVEGATIEGQIAIIQVMIKKGLLTPPSKKSLTFRLGMNCQTFSHFLYKH